jgi:DNA-binding MurR/RpiR family transcriptional regulator
MSIQSTIEAAASTLTPSLARIALVVRENPSVVIDNTINELAAECDTSVASVVRFCRAIGFSGYAPLRMALAAELGKEAAQFSARGAYGSEISDADTLQEAVSKVAALELLAIEETVARLDFTVLEAAVDAIDGAERIILYGLGASRFVAEDLAHKLLRVGRNAHIPRRSARGRRRLRAADRIDRRDRLLPLGFDARNRAVPGDGAYQRRHHDRRHVGEGLPPHPRGRSPALH